MNKLPGDLMVPGLPTMFVASLVAGLLALSSPRIVPPGNVWGASHTVAIFTLLAGSTIAGWKGLRFMVGVLGAAAAAGFTVWLPDNRDYLSIGRGHESLASYLIRYALFILATALACRFCAFAAGRIRHRRDRRRASEQSTCTQCGYNLHGLPENRCPECGTPFDPPPPPSRSTPAER